MKTFQLESYENGLQSPVVIEPDVFHDERGYFVESYNEKRWKEILGDINFVQDNESKSCYGVLRGLHFQKICFLAFDVLLDTALFCRNDNIHINCTFLPESPTAAKSLIILFVTVGKPGKNHIVTVLPVHTVTKT